MEERLRRKGVDVDAAKSPTRDDEDDEGDEYAATSAFVTRGDVPGGEDVCERVAELAFRQDAEGWPAQKTEAWKFARASALTASDVACVLEGGDARGKVLRQKQRVRKEEESSMTPSTETKCERRRRAPTSAAIRHGNEFEAEALAHYERTHGTTCLTFGLKIHDDHYWLGASPDGVHPSGRVVEIKCPYSRAVVPRAPSSSLERSVTSRVFAILTLRDPTRRAPSSQSHRVTTPTRTTTTRKRRHHHRDRPLARRSRTFALARSRSPRDRARLAWARSSPSPRPRAPSSSTPREVPVPRSPTVLYNNSASPRASRTIEPRSDTRRTLPRCVLCAPCGDDRP